MCFSFLFFAFVYLKLLPGKPHGLRSLPTVDGVAKSQTRLSDFTFTFHFHALEKEMFPGGGSGKEATCQSGRRKKCVFDPWARNIS